MRLRSVLLVIVLALLAASAAGIAWLLYSNAGANWLWSRALAATDGALAAESLGGSVRGGLEFRNVRYRHESVDVAARELKAHVDFRLFPFSAEVETATLADVQVVVSDRQAAEGASVGADEAVRQLQLPFELRFGGLVADDISLQTPGFTRTVQRLELRGAWHDRIDIDRLYVTSEGIELELDADFDPARDLSHVGHAVLTLDPAVTGLSEALTVRLASDGSHRRLGVRADVDDHGIGVTGEVRHLLEQPEWDLEVTVPDLALPVGERDRPLAVRGLTLRTAGSVDAYTLHVGGQAEDPVLGTAMLAVLGAGSSEGFEASSLRIAGATLDVGGTASVRWAGERELKADVYVWHFDATSLVDGWPEGQPLQGSLHVVADDARIRISDTLIDMPGTGAVVRVDGGFERRSGAVDGRLQWRNLRWPLVGDDYLVKSDEADVVVAGTVEAWTIRGRVDVGTPGMPDGRFDIDGGGDRQGARARVLDAALLGGALSGDVDYSWSGSKPWRARLEVRDIETAPLLADWPGRLSGRVEANGTGRPRSLEARLEGVSGSLRGADLTAAGGVALEGGRFRASELSVIHGDSRLWLDGALDDADGLAFDTSIIGLGQYLADAAGRLSARGAVRSARDAPFLSLHVDAESVEFRDVQVNGLTVRDDRRDGDIARLEVHADEVRTAGRSIYSVDAGLVATPAQQSLRLGLNYLEGRLSLALDGALDDVLAPATSTWRGALHEVVVELDEEHSIALLEPAAMTLSPNAVNLEAACLGNGSGADMCLDAAWSSTGRYAVRAALHDVPVGLVEHLTNIGLRFDQRVNGTVEWADDPDDGPSGFGNLLIRAGRIVSVDDPSVVLETGDGSLAFDIAENRLLSGAIVMPLQGTGDIHGNFVVEDVDRLGASTVRGELHCDIVEIAVLSRLFPALDSAGGHLVMNATVTGTLEAPLFLGDLRIDDGSIDYLPIGLRLRDIGLEGRLTEGGKAELAGSFAAGDGRGDFAAAAEFGDFERPRLQVDLSGENILLVDVPDVRLLITPRIRVMLEPELLTINGALLVPHARVRPVDLSSSRTYESQDVVIVAGELRDPVATKKGNGIRYAGSLGVALGNDIVIDVDVARATVSGLTRFDWKGEAMPIAFGRYEIAGTISAFGQVLDVTEGSVRFPGVRADNPMVRIRAEREIYGNTQVKRAGVLIDGPAKRPSVEAYTQPPTTEERALALLVTGSDFDLEQGVGAIDFGTYIAPRLFVSYGVGVFERDNIISARFDLTDVFGIKASSGSKESGIDLNYRYEN